jgi:hypothetical protein
VVNAAALLLFAASLLSYFIPFDIAITLKVLWACWSSPPFRCLLSP